MSCNISFFSKDAFWLNGHMMRVSSMIRADQPAEFLGARINPESGYENDVCIYVKPNVPKGLDFKFEGHPYLDIIDGWGLIPVLLNHPEVSVICCSKMDMELLAQRIPNKLIFIPQHHCNFERAKRTRTEIKTIGVIGTAGAFPYLPEGLETSLQERGLNLLKFCEFKTRQDIVDFYQKIDVQVVWRPYKKRLANPLKLVNASSFGIPTIALHEDYFDREFSGHYFPVQTLEEFLTILDALRTSPTLYNDYCIRLLQKSEDYHIENVAKLYRGLT